MIIHWTLDCNSSVRQLPETSFVFLLRHAGRQASLTLRFVGDSTSNGSADGSSNGSTGSGSTGSDSRWGWTELKKDS